MNWKTFGIVVFLGACGGATKYFADIPTPLAGALCVALTMIAGAMHSYLPKKDETP